MYASTFPAFPASVRPSHQKPTQPTGRLVGSCGSRVQNLEKGDVTHNSETMMMVYSIGKTVSILLITRLILLITAWDGARTTVNKYDVYLYEVAGVIILNQPKQCTMKGESPQIYHTFALLKVPFKWSLNLPQKISSCRPTHPGNWLDSTPPPSNPTQQAKMVKWHTACENSDASKVGEALR